MTRSCNDQDLEAVGSIINEGAEAYKGVIPADCLREPYMSFEALTHETEAGVRFWGYEKDGTLVAVMGIQQVQDVTLIRHAYVRAASQKQGIGGQLLTYLLETVEGPVLIGAWADAVWAVRFYEKHGFRLVSPQDKNQLLKKYWTVSERQIETSVVLANQQWRKTS
jgi:N-acetylglutamate synthase-like GNAT family acetyltransferase